MSGPAGQACPVHRHRRPVLPGDVRRGATAALRDRFRHRGDPERLAAWERAWEQSETFRRDLRLLTVAWGAGLLIESVARVVVVYALPVDRAVVAAQLPMLIAIVLLVVLSRILGPRLRRAVQREVEPSHDAEPVG
jgi:hypothetical protein